MYVSTNYQEFDSSSWPRLAIDPSKKMSFGGVKQK